MYACLRGTSFPKPFCSCAAPAWERSCCPSCCFRDGLLTMHCPSCRLTPHRLRICAVLGASRASLRLSPRQVALNRASPRPTCARRGALAFLCSPRTTPPRCCVRPRPRLQRSEALARPCLPVSAPRTRGVGPSASSRPSGASLVLVTSFLWDPTFTVGGFWVAALLVEQLLPSWTGIPRFPFRGRVQPTRLMFLRG